MERPLVVVSSDDRSKDMLREAGELAAGVGAELIVLHVTTEEEFQENQDNLAKTSAGTSMYNVETAQEGARQYAANLGREVLDGLNIEFIPIGVIGERRDEILTTARKQDCDYVFISGKKRSPTGKALFGDETQSIILNFEGSVVVRTN
jgi:nucleotide-binding universal stress UspA family protein